MSGQRRSADGRRGSSRRKRPGTARRHLSLVRDDDPMTPARALDLMEARLVRRLARAGVALEPQELQALAQGLVAEAVAVAVAWLESA